MTHFGTKQVISYYYEHIYNKICSSNPILAIAERLIESTFSARSKNRLEIGGRWAAPKVCRKLAFFELCFAGPD